MAEQNNKVKDFALADFKLNPLSSAENVKNSLVTDDNDDDILSLKVSGNTMLISTGAVLTDEGELVLRDAEDVKEAEKSEKETEIKDPIFEALAAPKLPEPAKEDRARLQMQSPNRINFYWSFKENPYQILNRIFGSQTNYQLVAKLLNQTNSREEIYPIEADGSAWFDVDADSSYRVEVGFYAVSRPFVRVLFSNTLQTPRKSPSPRQDYSEYFAVSADQFARVLDVSGYQQDAFEVALAGDDIEAADAATETAFSQIFNAEKSDFDQTKSGEWRFILLALASGYSLEELRGYVSPSLFAFLQTRAEELSAEKTLAALQTNFDLSDDEIYEEEFVGETVYGTSLVNFPRSLKRRTLPKFSPFSPNQQSVSSDASPRLALPKSKPLSSLR
jgi:hypothetical protein